MFCVCECFLEWKCTHPPPPKPEEGSGDKLPGFDPTPATGLDDLCHVSGPGFHCLSGGRQVPLLAHGSESHGNKGCQIRAQNTTI